MTKIFVVILELKITAVVYCRLYRCRPHQCKKRHITHPHDGTHGVISYYNDIIMGVMASQITSLTIVDSTVYSDTDQRKHQSSMSLMFVGGIHRWPVNSLHKLPVMRKMFPSDDVFRSLVIDFNINFVHTTKFDLVFMQLWYDLSFHSTFFCLTP